jgi:DNA modification methylase
MQINKIYNEDCTITMKKMKDEFVDVVVTSPPYNLGEFRMNGNGVKRKYDTYKDNLPIEEYFEKTKEWIDELLRVTKHHIFWNIGEYKGCKGISRFIQNTYKENLKETFIWCKPNPNPNGNIGSVTNSYEYIFCISKDLPNESKFTHHNLKGMIKNFIHKGVNNGKDNNGHGYAFGEWLPKHFIHHFSKEGDLIYDPFMGTGTTAIAAHKLDRKWIGSEISEKYTTIANNRIRPVINQTKLF